MTSPDSFDLLNIVFNFSSFFFSWKLFRRLFHHHDTHTCGVPDRKTIFGNAAGWRKNKLSHGWLSIQFSGVMCLFIKYKIVWLWRTRECESLLLMMVLMLSSSLQHLCLFIWWITWFSWCTHAQQRIMLLYFSHAFSSYMNGVDKMRNLNS